MKLKDLLARYVDEDPKIQEYMSMIGSCIKEQYGHIPDEFVISMDMMIYNLRILLESVENLKTNGISSNDKYRGEKKSAAQQTFFNAQNYINKILSSFALTPTSKSKIKQNLEQQDLKEYLANITQ